MQPNKEEILQTLRSINRQLASNGIRIVGLFGSFAKESANTYSDIDIAVKKSADFFKHHGAYDYFDRPDTLKRHLIRAFNRPVDLFDLDSQSPLKERIEKELIHV